MKILLKKNSRIEERESAIILSQLKIIKASEIIVGDDKESKIPDIITNNKEGIEIVTISSREDYLISKIASLSEKGENKNDIENYLKRNDLKENICREYYNDTLIMTYNKKLLELLDHTFLNFLMSIIKNLMMEIMILANYSRIFMYFFSKKTIIMGVDRTNGI